jgi:GAF domain-containing protein
MTDYKLMNSQLMSLSDGVGWDITILSNAAALLWDSLEDINWAGFYLVRGGRLELGPFQGKPACMVIEIGKGVCGTAVAQDRTQLVKNVHEFPGHIACDSASNSEIVVPMHAGGNICGVLDIDSPILARFDEEDKAGLEAFVRILESILEK